MENSAPIRVTSTLTLHDLRVAGYARLSRSKALIRAIVAFVICVVVGCMTSRQGSPYGGYFFFGWAALIAATLALWAIGIFSTFARTWKANGRAGTATEYSFADSGISAASALYRWEAAWALFERYIVLSQGVVVVFKTKNRLFVPSRDLGDTSTALLALLAAKLPSTAYFDDKL